MQPRVPCHLRSNPPPYSRRLFYNAEVKTWDVIIIGGGIIGLSLSIALRKRGASAFWSSSAENPAAKPPTPPEACWSTVPSKLPPSFSP